jgi:hypothetical protein
VLIDTLMTDPPNHSVTGNTHTQLLFHFISPKDNFQIKY